MPLYTSGNQMIDGDDGSHPFSPNYKEKDREQVTICYCPDCNDYHNEDGEVLTKEGHAEYPCERYKIDIEIRQCEGCRNESIEELLTNQ